MTHEVQNAVREQIARTIDKSLMRQLTYEAVARQLARQHVAGDVALADVRQLVDDEVNAVVASIRARSASYDLERLREAAVELGHAREGLHDANVELKTLLTRMQGSELAPVEVNKFTSTEPSR